MTSCDLGQFLTPSPLFWLQRPQQSCHNILDPLPLKPWRHLCTTLYCINFLFFSFKLCYLLVDTTVFKYYKHSNLTAKIGKRVKTKFGRIDSWFRKVEVLFMNNIVNFDLNNVFQIYSKLNTKGTAKTDFNRFIVNVSYR